MALTHLFAASWITVGVTTPPELAGPFTAPVCGLYDAPLPSVFATVLPRLFILSVNASIDWLVPYSCEPLIASVLDCPMRPAATLVIVRSTPGAPTLTVPIGVVPANE
ncbi:hemagluttinin family domain protein [Burkholderia pseudomallei NAU20B-16]|nr:hemagluttinin family domain protein [Burkholderia pseudomallei NAU20B-16]